ncbi:MAG: hypothetical protein F4080_15510 [Holophagales bacterium]|nr:hypothetical protein [Holophagales bacterium]
MLPGFCLLLVAAGAQGQQFASLASATDDRSAAARAGGTAIVVDHDLVRSGPQRLELQGTDGRILVAERSVFEDRGDGNVMWAGRFPGADYDSVVLTVQDGHLQGMFGEPGRAAHWIRSGRDGRGLLDQPVGGVPVEFCGGGLGAEESESPAVVATASTDRPVRVSSASNHDRLDILVVYTVRAALVWDQFGYGTPRASVQAAMDFLNLVLRNNDMPVRAHLVHLAEAPAALVGPQSVWGRLRQLREIAELRFKYQADMYHLFTGETSRSLGYCGIARLLRRVEERSGTFSDAYGVTSAACSFPAQEGAYPYFGQVFAHEIGHNLGANHDPANTNQTQDTAVRPWAFGHVDISVAPTVETIMSYRSYQPRQWVPFFSSVRITPNGWTIGREGARENERALYDTVPLAVQYSDKMPDPAALPESPSWVPAAPAELTVKSTSRTSARLEWEDRSDDELGFRIHAKTGGDIWRIVETVTADREFVEVTGLKPEGRYTFRVRAHHDLGGSDSDLVTVTLRSGGDGPGPGPGGISVPDDITATVSGATAVELGWSGAPNGTVEVEARSWKEGWRNVASTDAAAGRVTVEGLDAEAPYTFRLRLRATSGKVSSWSDEVNVTTGDVSGACRSGDQYLCLSQGRFEIQVHWKDHNRAGVYGNGTAVPIDVSDESGMFWFFSSSNIELVVKTLDGRGVNGHYWVFFGALSDVEYWVSVRDTAGGGRRTYHNPPTENCGQSDITAFVPASASGSSDGAAGRAGVDLIAMKAVPIELPGVTLSQEGGGTCEPGADRLCLHDGRFSVEVEFADPNVNEKKAGQVVSSLTTRETGFFWFFSPTNVELAAKVLDGRALTGKYWFLYGGLSDVEYTITLTDTVTRESNRYVNEAGSLCGGIDTRALPR